jgi:hypothetical protein
LRQILADGETMTTVFVVQHEYEWCGHDEVKLIGVYSTRSDAEAAVARSCSQPGFRNWPDGFSIDEYKLGEDHWTEGFAIMVTILLPTNSATNPYIAAVSAWHPGDRYEICCVDEEDAPFARFQVGDMVSCIERSVDGNRTALVAVALAECD